MTIYQRILQYYISSVVYFQDTADWFWESYCHFGVCGKDDFSFESEPYHKCKKRLQAEYGYHLLLDDKLVQKYFTELDSENKLFAVIFAHWFGLTSKQITHICKVQSSRKAWDLLNSFITSTRPVYYIKTDYGEIIARKSGTQLIDSNGTVYEIN